VSEKNGATPAKPDVDALREDIRQTRAELGETVQALAAKADVKARAKDSVEQTKAKVKAQAAEATERVADKVKEATHTATDAVRNAAATARGTAAQAGDKVKESGALDKAYDAKEQVRRNPVPLGAVLVGVVAVIGVILIVRGRRR
jgi:cobalamin biosynthesis Mg chelatase CobN